MVVSKVVKYYFEPERGLKYSSSKGVQYKLKNLLHQYYYNENFVHNLIENYNYLKNYYTGKKNWVFGFKSDSLLIPYGILYGLYFFNMRKNYFVNNKKSTIKQNDLKELKIYQASLKQDLIARIPTKDEYNLYMIATCLNYLLNNSAQKSYQRNNVILLNIASIELLVDYATIKEYAGIKAHAIIGIGHQIQRYIARSAFTVGEVKPLFKYNVPSEESFFPSNPWTNERLFYNLKQKF